MKRIAVSVLASVLIFAATSYAPPAHASGQVTTLIDYYDHNLNNVGSSYKGCNLPLQTWGTLAGEWKEVRIRDCDALEDETITDYHYCSGTWVEVGYIGDPSC